MDFETTGVGGPATQARFDATGLAVDARGNIFLSDYSSTRVYEIDAEVRF